MILINNSGKPAGAVHNLCNEVIKELKLKHPEPGSKNPSVLLNITSDLPDLVIFQGADASCIQNTAEDFDGVDGPSQVNAQIWKHIISRFHLNEAEKLAQTVADLVKILCSKHLPLNT